MPIIGVALVVFAVAASTAWAVRLLRVGIRDANDLAAKLAIPRPRRAADWPELRIEAVVFDPESANRVLVVARWPTRPESRSLLVLDVEDAPKRAQRLLTEWRDAAAPVSPRAGEGTRLVLRRRQTTDAVCGRVVRELT